MRNYDYLIVGAGLFGSTMAFNLNLAGKKCLVIDKRKHIAGNCYTVKKNGIDIHRYGAHIFHTSDKEVWDFANNFADFVPFINQPIAMANGKAYNLPFNMNTFCQLFEGVLTPYDALFKINEERKEFENIEPKNLEQQAINLVGRTVYETLIKGYTEKQWGRKCEDLPPEIIKRLPVRFIFDNNYFDDIYQGIPKKGYTNMMSEMLVGVDVALETTYEDIKNEITFDKVIYTGALDELFGYRYGKLEYRTLRFEDKEYQDPNKQGTAVINYTTHEFPYTRSIEHKHFNKAITPSTIVSYEYSKEFESGDEPYYPIGDEKNLKLYNGYKLLADKDKRLIIGGRLGLYKYFDMDDTIREALNLSEKLLK